MFYVYVLKDPRCSTVFYVGKGSGKRAWSHVHEVASGKATNQAKAAKITAILEAGQSPVVEKVAEYECEADAYEHERDLIASTEGLTNILAGHGWSLTKEEAARRAKLRAERIERRERARTVEVLRAHLREWAQWPDVVFYGIKNGVEQARAFVRDVQDIVDKYDAEPNLIMVNNG